MNNRLQQWAFPFFIAAYLLLAATSLHDYICLFSAQALLGITAFILSLRSQPVKKTRSVFAIITLAIAALSICLPVKTAIYACIVMAAFFAIESFRGRISALSLLALALTSPIFDYAVNIFSFPIRLWLTGVAGKLLALTGAHVVVEGNVISYNGTDFSVDPACMGLHMLVISLLATVLLMALFTKKQKRQLSCTYLLMLLVIVTLLNIIGNLFRILSLVFFSLLPGSPMHDLMGLACWTGYVLVPACCLSNWLVKHKGTVLLPANEPESISEVPQSASGTTAHDVAGALIHVAEPEAARRCSKQAFPGASKTSFKKLIWQNAALMAIVTLVVITCTSRSGEALARTPLAAREGFNIKQLPGAVTQLQNKEVLIYLKAITGFYASEHHPMICWKGSGYEFRKVKTYNAPHHQVYTAQLERKDEKLYTAWWYTNGSQSTISQWQWRWDLVRGSSNYVLVNITANSEAALQKYLDFSL
ncbi:exosortase N [Filimonas effusa]|uniref:Exosortase N n=1 Tax=Filimonas effusa TaxID=2508721 RepID=A0A4Q1DBI3_9BACT|nr:exosortase N [Filimonas effusa]RXK85869.1 exosortase N [Filimonas effusa]